MPTYEYKCASGHLFEKFYPRISNRRRVRCPTCGKRAEQLISRGTGLVFKGSGFYATDYPRAGEKKEKEEKPAESKPSEGEAKPAEKPAETGKPKKDSSSSDK